MDEEKKKMARSDETERWDDAKTLAKPRNKKVTLDAIA